MNLSKIMLGQSVKMMQNYVTWIQRALLFILRLKIFMKILKMIMKKDLMHETLKMIDHRLQVRT